MKCGRHKKWTDWMNLVSQIHEKEKGEILSLLLIKA
jgi:hypothetical protein